MRNSLHVPPIAIFCLLARAVALAEDAGRADVFAEAGVTGTSVITPLQDGRGVVHDEQRSSQRFPVASTFKTLNTLIALEERAIADGDELTWDGGSREIAAWNHDQTLESAFRTSCVWCFQGLARKVGAAKYESYLAAIRYGELKRPFHETTFWLDGSLKASAVEQSPQHSIRANTGWATSVSPQVGWYVGYVETAKGTWVFAVNLDIRTQSELQLRQEIARDALRSKGIIE